MAKISMIAAMHLRRGGVWVPKGAPIEVDTQQQADALIASGSAEHPKNADDASQPNTGRLVQRVDDSVSEVKQPVVLTKPVRPDTQDVLFQQIADAAVELDDKKIPTVASLMKRLGYKISLTDRDEACKGMYETAPQQTA